MRNQHVLIDHIISCLFSSEKRRLENFIATMIDTNQEASGTRLDGFHYQGTFYRREGLRGQLVRKVLHLSLHRQMDDHLADAAKITSDEQEIRQTLFKLMNPCVTINEIRDTLPNCLTNTLPDWASRLDRVQEEAWSIQSDARAVRQYNKVLPKIELYSAARLLY